MSDNNTTPPSQPQEEVEAVAVTTEAVEERRASDASNQQPQQEAEAAAEEHSAPDSGAEQQQEEVIEAAPTTEAVEEHSASNAGDQPQQEVPEAATTAEVDEVRSASDDNQPQQQQEVVEATTTATAAVEEERRISDASSQPPPEEHRASDANNQQPPTETADATPEKLANDDATTTRHSSTESQSPTDNNNNSNSQSSSLPEAAASNTSGNAEATPSTPTTTTTATPTHKPGSIASGPRRITIKRSMTVKADIKGMGQLQHVPRSCLLNIFCFVESARDLASLGAVCKTFKNVADEDQFWLRSFTHYYKNAGIDVSLDPELEEILNGTVSTRGTMNGRKSVKLMLIDEKKKRKNMLPTGFIPDVDEASSPTLSSPRGSPAASSSSSSLSRRDKGKVLEDLDPSGFYLTNYRESEYVEESNDPSQIEFEGNEIFCATLDRLVQALTSHKFFDMNFLFSFMLTYRSLTTAEQLWDKLLDRYNTPPPRNCSRTEFAQFKKDILDKIRVRVTQTFKYWLENHFYDFDDVLMARLRDTITVMERTNGAAFAKILSNTLEKVQQDNAEGIHKSKAAAPPKSIYPTAHFFRKSILLWPSLETARQLSLIDFEIFRKIRPKECLNQSWNKEYRNEKAPNISSIITRFNLLSNWVGTQVLLVENMKKRAHLISKFIKIAQKCDRLNNFNGVYAIVSGLNLASVYRLKKTWQLVNPEEKKSYEYLQTLISRERNFKTIRNRIKNTNPPCIPYIGLYLTDLTFIEDGNPKKINDKYNFMKCKKFSMVIRDMQTYQQTPYNFHPVKELQDQLMNLTHLNEEEQYQLSLKREPKVTRRRPAAAAAKPSTSTAQ